MRKWNGIMPSFHQRKSFITLCVCLFSLIIIATKWTKIELPKHFRRLDNNFSLIYSNLSDLSCEKIKFQDKTPLIFETKFNYNFFKSEKFRQNLSSKKKYSIKNPIVKIKDFHPKSFVLNQKKYALEEVANCILDEHWDFISTFAKKSNEKTNFLEERNYNIKISCKNFTTNTRLIISETEKSFFSNHWNNIFNGLIVRSKNKGNHVIPESSTGSSAIDNYIYNELQKTKGISSNFCTFSVGP